MAHLLSRNKGYHSEPTSPSCNNRSLLFLPFIFSVYNSNKYIDAWNLLEYNDQLAFLTRSWTVQPHPFPIVINSDNAASVVISPQMTFNYSSKWRSHGYSSKSRYAQWGLCKMIQNPLSSWRTLYLCFWFISMGNGNCLVYISFS